MFIWLLVLGMVFCFYRPFTVLPALDEFSTEIVRTYIGCIVVIWLLGWLVHAKTERSPIFNIMSMAILLYTFVATISALASPYYASPFESTDWFRWIWRGVVLFVLIVTSIKTEKDFKVLLTVFSVGLFIGMAHAFGNYVSGHTIRAGGTERLALGTLIYSSMLPLIFPLVTLCKKYWHYLFVLGYILLTFRVLMLTGSRTALASMVIILTLIVLFSRYRLRGLLVILVACPILWIYMPEGLQGRYRAIFDPMATDTTARLTVELRAQHFYEGLENWSNRPILGVGPGAHGHAAGRGMAAHNIYGQIAGELGTVGIVAFLFFLTCFGVNHYNIWKNYKYLQEKSLGKEGLYCWRVSQAVMYSVAAILAAGLGMHYAFAYNWLWLAAFQVLAAMFMQEKVTAAMQGKLLPTLPVRR